MAQAPLQTAQQTRSMTEVMNLSNNILEDIDGLTNFLFPLSESQTPKITREMVEEVRSAPSLSDRIYQSFLHFIKTYGFMRYRVDPLRIILRPAGKGKSKGKKDPAASWLKAESYHHGRIARLLSVLRMFGLDIEAAALYEVLSENQRIVDVVCEESKAKWAEAMQCDPSTFFPEAVDGNGEGGGSSPDSLFEDPKEGTGGLSDEQRSFLERLLCDGAAKFGGRGSAGRKRGRNGEEDEGNSMNKRQKRDQGVWEKVEPWLESYREQPASWKGILERSMRKYRDNMDLVTLDKQKGSAKIPYYLSNVLHAIGSFWDPLRHTRPYAFGDDMLFDLNPELRKAEHASAYGKRHERFIFPMIFQSDAQKENPKDKRLLAHLVLVVASRTIGERSDVRLQVYDSKPGVEQLSRIEREAQDFVRLSQWLFFEEFERGFVPVQERVPTPMQSGGESCGLHVVLIAWAIMLGIPIHPDRARRNKERFSDEEFVHLGEEIVNRALSGQMDSRTVQAFLNVSGLSVEQVVSDESAKVDYVEATAMNKETLARIVQEESEED